MRYFFILSRKCYNFAITLMCKTHLTNLTLVKFKIVGMLLIGMISFTAMATTPLTDKNKKTEFVKHSDAPTNAVIVVDSALISNEIEAVQLKPVVRTGVCKAKTISITYEASDHDVGWQILINLQVDTNVLTRITTGTIRDVDLNKNKTKIPIRNS